MVALRTLVGGLALAVGTSGCSVVSWVHETSIEPIGAVTEVAEGTVAAHDWRYVTYVSTEGEATRWYLDGEVFSTAWNHTGLERPGRRLSADGGADCGIDLVLAAGQVTRAVSTVDLVIAGEVTEELEPVFRGADAPFGLVATVVHGTGREVTLVARDGDEELDREVLWSGHSC
jgi:hypothetical protein